jgi:hypothetical protein
MEVVLISRRIRVANWHLDPNVLPSPTALTPISPPKACTNRFAMLEAQSGAANLSIISCCRL